MNQRGFISPTLLMNPWMLAGLAATFAIYSFVLYNKGYNSGYSKYVEYKAQTDAAQARIAAENAAKLREAETATRDVSLAWDRAVNDLRADYTSRLRGVERGCTTVSANAETSKLTDAIATHTRLSADFQEAAVKLESDCAVTTGQLIWLQDWTRRVCR